jgi:hypothetical protein
LLSLAVIPWNARGQPASTPTANATRPVQVASPSNAASVPGGQTGETCMKSFPYSAAEFLRKLLLVANEADPYAVPARFEQAFDMKLHPYGQASARSFIYQTSSGSCEWYTQVHINSSSDLKISGGVRVQLGMGAIAQPLTFDDPRAAECLSTESIDRVLQADGWSAQHVDWEIVLWSYRKGRTTIQFLPNGSRTPNGPECLTELTVSYR